MTTAALLPPSLMLPWARPSEDDLRFRRILLATLGLLALLGLAMPYLPLALIVPPLEPEPLPKRYVELIPTPPAPPAQVVTPPPQAPAAKEAEIAQQPSPRPAPAAAPSAAPRQQGVGPQTARQQAERAGLVAMRESLASLRRSPVPGSLNRGRLTTGGGNAGEVERSILTSRVGDGSGGIDVAQLSRGIGGGGSGSGGGFGDRTTSRVASPIGAAAGGAGGGAGRRNKMASRTDEEIQLVFDRNKGSIFGIYNRALRSNADLQGKLVLRLTIMPSGEVADIGMLSSELGDPELERKLLLRIRQFNFGAKEVQTVTVTYPIEFFPS